MGSQYHVASMVYLAPLNRKFSYHDIDESLKLKI